MFFNNSLKSHFSKLNLMSMGAIIDFISLSTKKLYEE
jgi:hypothetical protein